MLYLGVDGGNTKTIALVCGADGRIAGHARTGCSDVYAVADADAVAEIVRAATAAIEAAGGGELACAYYSLAGADWPVDIAFYEDELSRRIPAGRTVVVNDAIGAIRCGPEDGVGCSLVCGTGTALGARAPRRPPLARQLERRAVVHDRPHARSAGRRGAQRARPPAAECPVCPGGHRLRRG